MNKLKIIKKKNSGRDNTGRVSVRHQGGEHKRYLRIIDFKRNKEMPGKVMSIEYDPNRSCRIALVNYADGEKRYIISPDGLKVGEMVSSGSDAEIKAGNALPLSAIPVGTIIHNIELTPGKGGQMARGAGTGAILSAKEGVYAHIKLPSGELRKVHVSGKATIGQVSNVEWKNQKTGKAGRNRNRGIRPTVRGVAMNPRSHPHGGGEGRSGIGMPGPKTFAGRSAVGRRRRPNKYSNKYILQRRKKKK